jgi:hypothetical protein
MSTSEATDVGGRKGNGHIIRPETISNLKDTWPVMPKPYQEGVFHNRAACHGIMKLVNHEERIQCPPRGPRRA